MKLVIVESPKKCETIRRYLGADYQVMASQGHIRDLSTRGKGGLGIDVADGFKPDYVISPKKGKLFFFILILRFLIPEVHHIHNVVRGLR